MKKILSLFLAMILVGFSGCSKNNTEKFSDYSFDYFDTVTTIIGFEKEEEKFNQNCDLIKEKLDYFHKLFNIYYKYENINNLAVVNESREPVVVEKDIINMLNFSVDMFNVTNGKVNIAMGSLLSVWHNYRTIGLNDKSNASLPSFSELAFANQFTDINDLEIDQENNTVFLKNEQTKIDVGAIAKGYAVEQTALFMEQKGITGYILNVGGNVKIVGKRKDNEKWKIGIENPDTDDTDNPYIEYLLLEDMSLVTSGSYQRFYTVDSKNYHHIIDSQTLMPADYFLSVSVLSEDSGLADALSTALFCMSYDDGLKIIEKFPSTEAMWVTSDGQKLYSSNFKKYCVN